MPAVPIPKVSVGGGGIQLSTMLKRGAEIRRYLPKMMLVLIVRIAGRTMKMRRTRSHRVLTTSSDSQ